MEFYHLCRPVQSPTTNEIHKVWLDVGGKHVCCRLAVLKGKHDPSIQVNSGQVTVVLLLPGGAGVLSEQNKG